MSQVRGEACVAISVINGYVCYSGCDAAKARTGQDPHPKSDPSQPSGATTPTAGGVQNLAVVFGGTLASRNAVAPAASSQPAAAKETPPPNAVDLYA
jgi:hypothetical protein